MNEKKQIEEMARFCCTTCEMFTNNPVGANKSPCALDNDYKSCPLCIEPAERLYNAGYRKQSEWISVEERLPEEKGPIIVSDGEKVIVAYRNWLYRSNSTGKLRCPANYGNGMYVTHWMPLPEAPKMKGGAE